MKLASFIRNHREEITQEWIRHAQENIDRAHLMKIVEVSDHIQQMLYRIADDMETCQTDDQQEEKSKGNKRLVNWESKAASDHGEQRLDFGFDFLQLSSEFRALRASVLRLWAAKSRKENWENDFYDMIRFNEAIDEIWMISLKHFQEKLDKSKNMFLGVLGHDLRNPIATVVGANSILKLSQNLSEKERSILQRSDSSIKRMTELINNLLELTELHLGTGMTIEKKHIDLGELTVKMVKELQLGYPQANLLMESYESVDGEWDVLRLEQMMTNLITNAVHHGEPGGAVKISLSALEDEAVFTVHNDGPPIPEEIKRKIFDGRFTRNNGRAAEKNYGLGLFIVKEIVEGHQGKIELTSTEKEGTTFKVFLPRKISAN